MERKKRKILCILLIVLLLLGVAAYLVTQYIQVHRQELFVRWRFGIRTVHSPVDADADGIEDLTDMMLAARAYVNTHPTYLSDYYQGGYPPDTEGVCTDVLWRALQAAGYDFKAMVDEDILHNAGLYPLPSGRPDTNIDFRRVVNLSVFFERCGCLSLTTDMSEIAEWQPGDIVVYEGHVALVSDLRNDDGRPYIIHHSQTHGAVEEDALDYKPITGHYRWIFPE